LRNGENKHQPVYREKTVYSTQFEEFKESGAFYEDSDAVVEGTLVCFRREAFAPLHSNVYVN